METFPKLELRPFVGVLSGSVFAAFEPTGLTFGLLVKGYPDENALSWIRFSDGESGAKWAVLRIDPEVKRSALMFEGARIALSFKRDTLGAGRCGDPQFAGSAFLANGEIAISGTIDPRDALLFRALDGSCVRIHDQILPYFSSWSIEVPDGPLHWRTLFSSYSQRDMHERLPF
jgi:hypothetical protein